MPKLILLLIACLISTNLIANSGMEKKQEKPNRDKPANAINHLNLIPNSNDSTIPANAVTDLPKSNIETVKSTNQTKKNKNAIKPIDTDNTHLISSQIKHFEVTWIIAAAQLFISFFGMIYIANNFHLMRKSVQSDRAWITHAIKESSADYLAEHDTYRIRISIKNSGRSPALNLKAFAGRHIIAADDIPEKFKPAKEEHNLGILGPDDAIQYIYNISPSVVDSAMENGSRVIIDLHIKYDTIHKKNHSTNFQAELVVDEYGSSFISPFGISIAA